MQSKKALVVSGLVLLLSACAHRDAAMIGAAVGHTLGAPLGAAVVAVDETFKTAGDVVQANPRYDTPTNTTSLAPTPIRSNPSRNPTPRNQETHYYRTEVIVQTTGPANIQSIELQESEDVTAFWAP